MLECFQRGSRWWCNPSIITTWQKRPPEQWDPGNGKKACLSALSLQDRHLLTQGIEMVVVYEETGQITTTPLTLAALHQAVLRAHYQLQVWNNDIVTQFSFEVTGGLWLEMKRRQESVDPSDDHTSPSTWDNHPLREMQMHEREVCQQPLQV